ncbi:AAA family ATPase [Bacillus arachidis]|uniref:AAA family ATPase n=1 Tax=Bacillus arachidis TaxID=2819290 RepID=A0ABS3NZ74_9BACI|nr:AAA family ATPase [Bacillus arachidis]MBO1626226.1 AAA family ATPase [Bacillus arachidis]
MTLICLEGASGIGKTTTCKRIAELYNAYVIPEVNFLFQRPNPEPENWYLERQVERWQLAQEKLKSYDVVLFDGDIFQPIWYNWIYEGEFPQTLPFLKEFYVNQMKRKQIGFPGVYIHLSTSETELRKRKENDTTQRRSNFEKHLRLIEPQKQYFQYMNTVSPNVVHFVDAVSIEENTKNIFDILSRLNLEKQHNYSVSLLENVMDWVMSSNSKAYEISE